MSDRDIRQVIEDSNRIGVELLIADARLGHTFLDSAKSTAVPQSRERRIAEAHKAYESILHLRTKLTSPPEQQAELDSELAQLRDRLVSFGVEVSH